MANISNTQGTIEFFANSKQTLLDLLEAFKWLEDFDYMTSINYDEAKVNIDLSNSQYHTKTFFNGAGRWTYMSNINNFARDIKFYASKYDCENIVKSLENSTWSIVCDFADEECGCEVLYEATVLVNHTIRTPLEKCKIQVSKEHNVQYTLANLIKFEFYDINDADTIVYVSGIYPENELADYEAEYLKNLIKLDELADLTKMSVKEFNQRFPFYKEAVDRANAVLEKKEKENSNVVNG